MGANLGTTKLTEVQGTERGSRLLSDRRLARLLRELQGLDELSLRRLSQALVCPTLEHEGERKGADSARSAGKRDEGIKELDRLDEALEPDEPARGRHQHRNRRSEQVGTREKLLIPGDELDAL